MAAVRVMGPLPVPAGELNDNQAALSLAVQLKVPPPVLVMVRVCAAGLLPPWVAVKATLVGLAPIAGAAATVKETGTVTGVTPVPPLRVTVPL